MGAVLVIQNLEREHLGFILTSFDVEIEENAMAEGDCVFQILPTKTSLLESPLVRALYPYHYRESGEHKVKLTNISGNSLYEILPKSQPVLKIELAADGAGKLLQHPDFSTTVAYIVRAVRKS